MALDRKTKATLDKVSESAASLQLAAERAADLLTYAAVDKASTNLVMRVTVEGGGSEAQALASAARHIKQTQAALAVDVEAALLEARAISREFAMRQLAVELEPLIATPSHGLVLTPSLAPAEVEAMWAHHGATSVARTFGTKAIGEVATWQQERAAALELPRRLSRVAARVEPDRKATAAYQSVRVFNDSKLEKLTELKEGRGAVARELVPPSMGDGKRAPDVFDSGMRNVWSGFLDGKTCPACWRLDGVMVKIDEPFPEGARTPLHGRCRCTVISVFIPEALQRYLPGAADDYEALKEDVQDYMRSRTRKAELGEGVRHAKRYVHDVLEQRGHSPVVLAERFNNRKQYFPNVVPSKAPKLVW